MGVIRVLNTRTMANADRERLASTEAVGSVLTVIIMAADSAPV